MPGLLDLHNHHMIAGQMDLFELNAPPTFSLIEGVDLEYWRVKGQELFDKMRRAYTVRDARNHPADELFPPVYARLER